MNGLRRRLTIAAFVTASVTSFSPLDAQDQSEDERILDNALDKVRDTSRNRLLAEIALVGVDQYADGVLRRFAPVVFRSAGGGPIGVFLAFMAPKQAGVGSDVVPIGPKYANDASQCGRASLSFSYRRYSESIKTIESQKSENSELARSRKKQMYDFWMDSRYQMNVDKCLLWFQSGRTSPYQPS